MHEQLSRRHGMRVAYACMMEVHLAMLLEVQLHNEAECITKRGS